MGPISLINVQMFSEISIDKSIIISQEIAKLDIFLHDRVDSCEYYDFFEKNCRIQKIF